MLLDSPAIAELDVIPDNAKSSGGGSDDGGSGGVIAAVVIVLLLLIGGFVYYQHQQKKTPPAAPPMYEVNEISAQGGDKPSVPPPSAGMAVQGLPAGWTQAVDPASGRPYYVNTSTNESSWYHPSSRV